MAVNEKWIPLVEYAHRTGLSMSTLRRYIKSNRLMHRLEHGRYLVWDDGGNSQDGEATRFIIAQSVAAQTVGAQTLAQGQGESKIKILEHDLKKAREQIAELKMLVALYEDQDVPVKRNPKDQNY